VTLTDEEVLAARDALCTAIRLVKNFLPGRVEELAELRAALLPLDAAASGDEPSKEP
jgi:hypothetical protein